MIQAAELRIGNKVNRPLKDDNEKRYFVEYTITGIPRTSEVRTDKGGLPIRAIEGIPLTEEWFI